MSLFYYAGFKIVHDLVLGRVPADQQHRAQPDSRYDSTTTTRNLLGKLISFPNTFAHLPRNLLGKLISFPNTLAQLFLWFCPYAYFSDMIRQKQNNEAIVDVLRLVN